ncbi:AMP-binding protein, partial [bacterium]|nr:AMP-binding protein [bacterium]
MNNTKRWQHFDVKTCQTEDEQKRFDLFYNVMLDKKKKIMFVGQLLQRGAALFSDDIALVYNDREISYKELYYRSVLFSKKLLSLGVKPRDRVLLFVPNSLEFYIGYFGVLQIGAVVAPLNIFLKERELAHIVNDAKPSLIVTMADKVQMFKNGNIPPIVTQQDMNIDEVLQNEPINFEPYYLDPEELAVLLYTSGTTGLPKGVMLSSKNSMTNVVQVLSRMPLCKLQRLFCVLPLFHSFAQNTCVWSAFFSGCSVIVVPKIDRRSLFNGLQHKPTIFLGVPALYGLLCMLKTVPLDSIEYFISGGDALPDKIRALFELIYRRKLCNGYGLTETSPLISVDLQDRSVLTNNVGRPVIGVDCILRNEHGDTVSKKEIGTLWVKGDNIMMGYYNAPEKTKEVLQDGWFCTGDFATFNDQGDLLICGRNKDLIIHKGLNIYPQEIENVILGHMSVMYVGVVGKKNELQEEIPCAFVQLRPGKKVEGIEKGLKDLCKKNL